MENISNISNVSSEEELLQLRNEGKISEEEYEELRSAMRKSAKPDLEPPPVAADKAKSKRKLGKVAFCLMLLPVVAYPFFLLLEYRTNAPVVGTRIMEPTPSPPSSETVVTPISQSTFDSPKLAFAIWPWFLLALILEIAAFVMGVIAWPDPFAKATVVAIAFIVVLAFLFKRW